MNTEQKIHAAYVNAVENNSAICHYTSFKEGYLALLNSLDEHDDFYVTCYRLPEGVTRG